MAGNRIELQFKKNWHHRNETLRFIKRVAGQHVMWLGQMNMHQSKGHASDEMDQYMRVYSQTHAVHRKHKLKDQNTFLEIIFISFIVFIMAQEHFSQISTMSTSMDRSFNVQHESMHG